MPSSRNKVFAFETPEQAWSFVNLASTAGYTMFEDVQPFLAESSGQIYHILVPNDYFKYMNDLKRISRSVKGSDGKALHESRFSFDKFVNDAMLCEGFVVDISTTNEYLGSCSLGEAQRYARHGFNGHQPQNLIFRYRGKKYSSQDIGNLYEAFDEPMRRRAQRHQELPQNRIRMINNG